MKRALAIAVALCTLGIVGFGQITGKWTGNVCLLPTTTLTSDLTIGYTINGITITSISNFGAAGLTGEQFALTGAFGPFNLSGNMYFDVTVPAYMGSKISTSFDFAGVGVGLKVLHWDTDYNANMFTSSGVFPYTRPFREYPILVDSPCQAADAWGMMYILTGKVEPLNVRASFVDCCEGIEFYDLYLWLDDLSLCCGIALDAEVYFLKEGGFQYLSLSGFNVPLCCGVYFDFGIEFGVDYKEISFEPGFEGLGVEGCFTVYGDALFDEDAPIWEGIAIYGFSFKCTLAECNYFEMIEAFNPGWMNTYVLSSADDFNLDCGEFELIKLGFCGASCCSSNKYTVDLKIWFGDDGGLFDITRFGFAAGIPLMENLTLNVTGAMPAGGTCQVDPTFCVGWTFTF